MFEAGSGPPLVLVPGIQGRWEWMRASIDALSKNFRVLAVSLPGEPGSESGRLRHLDQNRGFDAFVEHIDHVLDEASIDRAVICGVSFGGLIALRYAARRPERVSALILVSTPGPRWKPKPKLARYMKWPTLSSPLFFAGSIQRFWPELCVTHPDLGSRLRFCASTVSRIVAAPAVPSRMSVRAKLMAAESFEADCARVSAPTLVVTGERNLDKVVKHDETLEYLHLIKGARHELFDNTGHLGIVSAPGRFAEILSKFVRRIGVATI
jgi:pimeloyl-ACP methyl ester carboxylesterase